jgi:hypothetical protein
VTPTDEPAAPASDVTGPQPLVSFARVAFSPPPLRELLAVREDGTATGWRSNGPIVGRFASRVDRMGPLRAAIADLAGGGQPPGPLELVPDAAWEEVKAAGLTARFGTDDAVEGPWGALLEACRDLLDEMTDSPTAAIVILVDPDGHVRLEHRGDGMLPLELDSVQVSLTLWRDGREASRAAARTSAGRVEAGPGWSLDVPDASIDLDGGGKLVAVASFIADDDGVFVPVSATGIVDV